MKNRRILLVDDEPHIADNAVYSLRENSFEVITASDGDEGLRLFKHENPALVLLDLKLPGMSGLDLFREIKSHRPDVPVIMVTSLDAEADRIVGLELGADDYVTKPYSPRELTARVKAVLRRSEKPAGADGSKRLAIGPIDMDCSSYSLEFFGSRVPLTRGEFKLMECLVRYPARVFTRDMLVERIYDGEHVVTDRSIDAYIKRLRKKFEDVRPGIDPFETVHGLGYKLNQRIEELA